MPSVRWKRVISNVSASALDYDVTYDDVRAQLMTRISVTARTSNDYGMYRVTIENDRGSFEEEFNVVSQESPQPPQNLTAINVTLTSFCVTCMAGFDGGASQTFLLTFFTQSDDVRSESTEVTPVSSDDDVMSHCVTNLREDTVYDVRVCAENEYGRSGDANIRIKTMTESAGIKHEVPLCICNENVRLSYLETSGQGSYVDATSAARQGDVTVDVIARNNDVSGDSGTERRGSWFFGMGRRLGVEDLSRRPSRRNTV
ncbi:hypothetical protein ACOMHN_065690 [Nucella lapillus]